MYDYCFISALWPADAWFSDIIFACTWRVHFLKIEASWQQIHQLRLFIGRSPRRGVSSGSISYSSAGRIQREAARVQTNACSGLPVLHLKSMASLSSNLQSRLRLSTVGSLRVPEASNCHNWPPDCGALSIASAGDSRRWASLWCVKCLEEKKSER